MLLGAAKLKGQVAAASLARRNVALGGAAALTAASASVVALGMIGHPEPSLCKAATSTVDWYKVRAWRPSTPRPCRAICVRSA
jgi:hypothetical protein